MHVLMTGKLRDGGEVGDECLSKLLVAWLPPYICETSTVASSTARWPPLVVAAAAELAVAASLCDVLRCMDRLRVGDTLGDIFLPFL